MTCGRGSSVLCVIVGRIGSMLCDPLVLLVPLGEILGPPWFLKGEVNVIEACIKETMDGAPFLVTVQLNYLDGW